MEHLEILSKKIDENWQEQIETTKELISIRSVRKDPEEDKPFGEGVQEAFQYFLDIAHKQGFDCENIDNYGGHVEFGGYEYNEEGEMIGTSSEIMGILCHLDVVPEGNDWDYNPFEGTLKDGKLFGRGAIDNKGPAVAVLFAMKAIKDAGIIPEKKVRLILGLDEETKWEGIKYYANKTEASDFGFTPDADFPVVHGEKGILVFDIAKKIGKNNDEGLKLRSFKGGFAENMVADHARVVVNSKKKEVYETIKDRVTQLREEGVMKIYSKPAGKSLEITVQGVSAHGARPEEGVNAITHMMKFLGELKFTNDDVNDFIEFYNEHIGAELDGESFGCKFSDNASGDTIFNVGLIEMDTKSVRLSVNVRYPVTFSAQNIYDSIDDTCRKYSLGIVKKKEQKPIYIEKENQLVKTLMEVYREHTGDKESEPVVIGGGTYARAFDNVLAFGSLFPGEEESAHQKNEFIDLENLRKMTLIYADAIIRLTNFTKASNKEPNLEK